MSNAITGETLAVQGFTPYAQIPKWILRAGDKLSHGAVRLYGVIMTYADNDTKTAFPGREKLAQDMGASVSTVKRAIKELEEFHALAVERRRNQRTGNFYSNHYTLVFENPWATYDPPREVMDDPITTPTILTTPTPSFTSDKSDAGYTPDKSSATNPGNIPGQQRAQLRRQLQTVGTNIQNGKPFYHEDTQTIWWDFISNIEAALPEHQDQLADLLENGKWTVSAKVATAYEAGIELNKIIWKAMGD